MDGKAVHRCLHVLNLEKSIAFLREGARHDRDFAAWARGRLVDQRVHGQCHLGPPAGTHLNHGRTEPYDNGGRDSHLAFTVDDYEAARALHEEMGCICHVNEAMGLYFIEDPDGCWLEIPAEQGRVRASGAAWMLDAMARRRSLRRYSGEPIRRRYSTASWRRTALGVGTLAAGRGNSSSCTTEPCWTTWPNAANRARPCSPEPMPPSSSWPT